MLQKRNYSFDLLRIFCSFSVVCVHTTPMYSTYVTLNAGAFQNYLSLFIESFMRVGLPILVMISGILLLNRDIKDVAAFYKKRFTIILIPFLIIAPIHYVIVSHWTHAQVTADDFLSRLLNSTGISIHFWFVYVIVGIYIVSPMFSIMVNKIDSMRAWTIIKILAFTLIYNDYFSGAISGLQIPNFGIWLTYFIMGGLLTKVQIPRRIAWCTLSVGYFSTILIYWLHVNQYLSSSMAMFDSGFNMFLFSTSIVYLFMSADFKPGERIGNRLRFISTNTYVLYLIHITVQITLAQFIATDWLIGNVFSFTLTFSVMIFSLSLTVAIILNKLVINRITSFIMDFDFYKFYSRRGAES